jgi:hypothetical protein
MLGFQEVRVRDPIATAGVDGQVADGPVGVQGHGPDGAGGGVHRGQPHPPPAVHGGKRASGEQGVAGQGELEHGRVGLRPEGGVGDPGGRVEHGQPVAAGAAADVVEDPAGVADGTALAGGSTSPASSRVARTTGRMRAAVRMMAPLQTQARQTGPGRGKG